MVKIVNPALQSNIVDLSAVAAVPQKPQDEIETLGHFHLSFIYLKNLIDFLMPGSTTERV